MVLGRKDYFKRFLDVFSSVFHQHQNIDVRIWRSIATDLRSKQDDLLRLEKTTHFVDKFLNRRAFDHAGVTTRHRSSVLPNQPLERSRE